MARLKVDEELAKVHEFANDVRESLKELIGLAKIANHNLKPGVQEMRAALIDGSVTLDGTGRAPLSSSRVLVRDLVICANPDNADIARVGGPLTSYDEAVGHILPASGNVAFNIPDTPKYQDTYYDLSQIFCDGASGDVVVWTGITYKTSETV